MPHKYEDLEIGQIFVYNRDDWDLVLSVKSFCPSFKDALITFSVLKSNQLLYRVGQEMSQGAFLYHWDRDTYKLTSKPKPIRSRLELIDI